MRAAGRVLAGILFGVLGLVFAAGVGLGFIALTGFPYSADIDGLDIVGTSGYDRQTIQENYDAMMDYLNPFSREEWTLPSLAYSESGKSHFEECKTIFNALYIAAAASGAAIIILLCFGRIKKLSYKAAGFVTAGLPLVLGVAMAADFNGTFTVFHRLLFDNDDWIFDPGTDQIINILPAEFFMHCGILIAACILLMAAFFLFKGFSRSKEQI